MALTSSTTRVPPGVRVKWYQRSEELFIDIEAPDIQSPEVSMTDEGLITMNATVSNVEQSVSLQLKHGIDTRRSRWTASSRSVKFELAKSGVSRPYWDRLTLGDKLPNIVVDWQSWVDEDEDAQTKANPYGHDVRRMAGAMGEGFGSNLELTVAARKQAAAVDTSHPDEPDDEITMG